MDIGRTREAIVHGIAGLEKWEHWADSGRSVPSPLAELRLEPAGELRRRMEASHLREVARRKGT